MARQPQTMLAKLGFDDADSKTPEHDKIVSWLYKAIDELLPIIYPAIAEEEIQRLRLSAHAAAEKERKRILAEIKEYETKIAEYVESPAGNFQYLNKHLPDKRTDYRNHIEKLQGQLADTQTWGELGEVPDIPVPTVVTKRREKTINVETKYNKTAIGFIDFQAIVEVSRLEVATTKYIYNYPSGRNVPDKPRWHVYVDRDVKLNFEVKSRINNIGQVFRQINLYREYENGVYFVVAPDDGYAEELQQERIGFIKAPAEFAPKSDRPQLALW